MDHLCSCGEPLHVTVSRETLESYCQSCGAEFKGPRPDDVPAPRESSGVIPISRASILKKMNDKASSEQMAQKKPKQLRDRTNYTSQRGGRR